MMERHMMRLALATACLTVLVIAGLAATDNSTKAEEVTLPISCDPVLDRTIDPLIVDQGGEVDVSIRYNYRCTGQNRRVNFFLLVENTPALRPGGKLTLLNNLKKGLTNFVNSVDYGNGSMGGMTLYAASYQNRVTLQGGQTGRQNLLDAIGLISTEPAGGLAGVPGAVRDAHERLPDNAGPDTTNVLLIVDAGAQIDPNGPTLSDLGTSCKVANANTLMVLVGLRPAQNRLAGFNCVDSGWFFYSPTEDGSDLPALFNNIAEKLIKGKLASSNEYYEALNSADFQYVVGSGVPQEPYNPWGSEYSWSFPNPGPAGQVIRFRAKVVTENVPVGGLMSVVADRAELCLLYKDGTQQCGPAPNPGVCIRRRGVTSDCAGYRATLTPGMPPTTAPTGPPTATETARPTEPLETETPTEQPTVEPSTPTPTEAVGYRLYVPALLANGRF